VTARGLWRERSLLLLPAGTLLTVAVLVPVLRVLGLSLSFVMLRGGIETRWAGLAQFVRLWQDSRFLTALGNTIVFTTASVLLEMVLGVAFALVLHRVFRGRGPARAVVMLPWALPTAVMALAWAWIFNDSFGVANDLLERAGLIRQPLAWLGGPASAMASLVIADVWKTAPFVMLIALAGLQTIPTQVLEAARGVVLPLLAPALLVALAFRAIQAYGAFDLIYVMTGGGPGGSTETISLYAFSNYFRYLDFGYGSAIAVMGAILLGLLALAGSTLARLRRGA
jgi:multiple sugar transport system permease protein